MTAWQKTTLFVIIGTTLFLVIYDIIAAYYGGSTHPATISWMISWISSNYWGASIVLVFGFLMGHFFGQNNNTNL